ncbi:hypothetical protein GCM10010261_61160 [Streptomyces pilosus]|nr:hypothetical protein GCM10010261_61160 [Streptomyces pilosus]
MTDRAAERTGGVPVRRAAAEHPGIRAVPSALFAVRRAAFHALAAVSSFAGRERRRGPVDRQGRRASAGPAGPGGVGGPPRLRTVRGAGRARPEASWYVAEGRTTSHDAPAPAPP